MSNNITHATRLTVLKHLAGGKPADLVAKIMKLSRYEIIDIASEHGYPDVAQMAQAVAHITREIEAADREELAARPLAVPETTASRPAVTTTPPARPERSGTTAVPASGQQVLTQPDELRVVINAGKQSKSKRIQGLTNRIIEDLTRLKEAIRAEQAKVEDARRKAEEKAAAARARAAEREALEKKKAELEAELARVKAKLSGRKTAAGRTSRTISPAAATPGCPAETPAREIRSWAREAGLDVPATGRVPQKVRDAYAAAHRSEQAA